jgi:hypothetical protein
MFPSRPAMETVSTAYINRLPNEILSMIFEIVYEDDEPYMERLYPPRSSTSGGSVASILVLRWVSRRFRFIVNDLDFWRDRDFDLLQIFELPNPTPFRNAQFVITLLKDESIVFALSPKSSWVFLNVDTFFTTLINVPAMCQNTRKIEFNKLNVGLGFAIDRLSLFSCLVNLSILIDSYPGSETLVNFDAIVRSCPLLQELDIGLMIDYCGSLENAAFLRSLSVSFKPRAPGVRLSSALFPLKSAQVLSKFMIDQLCADLNDFDYKLFEPFVNLTSFGTRCFTPEFCNLLVNGEFFLRNLSIRVCSEYWAALSTAPTLPDLFFASSLERLRKLYFSVDCDTDIRDPNFPFDKFKAIIRAITSLRYLEILGLTMVLQLSWCDRFALLRNLKLLMYKIPALPRPRGT